VWGGRVKSIIPFALNCFFNRFKGFMTDVIVEYKEDLLLLGWSNMFNEMVQILTEQRAVYPSLS